MDIAQELEIIAAEHDGLLRAGDVVEYARDPRTMLHGQFTWDDTVAAEAYRLWQARSIIIANVTVKRTDVQPVRAWVSLQDDRAQPGGGYRSLDAVMSHQEMRQQLLRQALADGRRWMSKYRALKELEPVFAALDNVTHNNAAHEDAQRIAVAAD
jgi:hypothetical protein